MIVHLAGNNLMENKGLEPRVEVRCRQTRLKASANCSEDGSTLASKYIILFKTFVDSTLHKIHFCQLIKKVLCMKLSF